MKENGSYPLTTNTYIMHMEVELQPKNTWEERVIKNELMRLIISINLLTEARDSQSRYKESL